MIAGKNGNRSTKRAKSGVGNDKATLTFKNEHGKIIQIAEINRVGEDGQIRCSREIIEDAMLMIRANCAERNITVYYVNIWNREDKTIFDFGSHREFFYLTPAVSIGWIK